MVRYFSNPFEDHKLGVLMIDKDNICSQIIEHISNIMKHYQPSVNHVEGGLYVGTSGISFMFYCLSKNPKLSESRGEYFKKAMEYLKPALETSAGDKTSFLLGDAGTYALATVLYKSCDDKFIDYLRQYKALYTDYLNPKFLKNGGDEFFVGRAGYIAGSLWISREIQIQIFTNDELYRICDIIVASGRAFAKKSNSPCPLMFHYYNTQYLGAAHGISFILQILMSVPNYISSNESAGGDIKSTVDFIVTLQDKEGNWPCCMEEIGLNEHKLVHWCHGAPGIIYMMAKAYLLFKEDTYLEACVKAGEVVWHKGLLTKGPGICHGVAGNGYVFLLLYRLTHNEKYLYRAKMFADFMTMDQFQSYARFPDNPESLYEGTAGTVCFLSDLLVPDKAEFPFQDVFSIY